MRIKPYLCPIKWDSEELFVLHKETVMERTKVFSAFCSLRLCFLAMSLLLTVSSFAFTVVIDAGHGGHDPGALGAVSREKDLNLSVAKKLAKLIEQQDSGVQVFLTRSTDVFLTLQERADFVNKHNADLFICIHTNSADNKQVSGAETFTLGLDKRESNLDVAMRENAVMMLEDDYQTKYQGFDPNSVESYIMFEFMQDQYIDKSLQFASLVQQQFSGKLRRADRGVRQAAFWVLHKSACPSVLIEMGFISNREEEKFLVSSKGQDDIAQAVYVAFSSYKTALERREMRLVSSSDAKPAAVPGDKSVAKRKTEPVQEKPSVEESKSVNAVSVQDEQKTTAAPVSCDTEDKGDGESGRKPVFRVQIFSVTAPLKQGDASFKGLKGCTCVKDGRFYKYMYGEETDYAAILQLKKQLGQKFSDCFVVAFLGDEQILVRDAVKMTDNTNTK